MKRRQREEPCGVCEHFHNYEAGEPCGVCGHQMSSSSSSSSTSIDTPFVHKESAFPSEILKDFLYLGTYDHSSRYQALKFHGISHILSVSWKTRVWFLIWFLSKSLDCLDMGVNYESLLAKFGFWLDFVDMDVKLEIPIS